MEHVIDTLKARGLFDNWTSPEAYDLLRKPAVVYCGFDPSADSLQAGNFVAIMTLCHYQRAGHKVLALVGGATGMIGDPSGKTSERALQSEETIAHNVEGIRENLSRFLDFGPGPAQATLVNNLDWHGKFTFISYLRDVGRYFRMGSMLGKESVRQRLNSPNGRTHQRSYKSATDGQSRWNQSLSGITQTANTPSPISSAGIRLARCRAMW